MEILKSIFDFDKPINFIAFIIILSLMILAIVGTYSAKHPRLKKYAKQSPAILATVGIFFSFYGITNGLIALDLRPEFIKDSIPNLLDGLKVKFIASLMGIGASIIVRIVQNFAVEEEIADINLDEKIVGLLGDIHHVLANSANSSPEALLQELKEEIGKLPIEFGKQTILLESIKTSLVGDNEGSLGTKLDKVRLGIVDSFDKMEINNKQRSESLNSTLTTNFDNLTQKFEDFAKIVAENNSKAFIEALSNAMKEFNEKLAEQFGENFKELNRAVGELLTWQDNYKSHVETLTGNFEVALNSVATIQSAFSDIQTRSQSFTDVSAELGGILQKLDLQLQDLNHHLKSLDQVADSAKQAFPIIEDNLTKLTAGFKKSTEQSLADITSTVESVGENLVETTSRLKDTTGKLRDSMENQRESLEKTSDEFKEVVGTTLKSLAKETKTSIDIYSESLQGAVTSQLDSINSNIQKSNAVVNSTIQNASDKFEQSITDAGLEFKKTIQNTAHDFEKMAETVATSVELQEKTLVNVSQDLKLAVDRTLRDLSEQSKLSIREYENNLHNAVTTASKEFNRLLTENTTKSTNVLEQQTQLLDKALQDELKKAIETMGKHLAALSNQFVQDYRPLTDKLREVVKLAEDLKRGR
ncbi:MAG: hypothetical protein PHN45_04450 [Methylococcales bacterium]|nr:hypothetical protein [Methylococcales bacterium]MDD5753986.1 hypothetical protein [Methylococcales bacterium]